MVQYRLLTDKDIEKIVDFTSSDFFNDNKNYISNNILSGKLNNETILRQLIFNGNLIFYGGIVENEIKNLAIISLPETHFKKLALSLYWLSLDNKEFVNNCIDFIKKYFRDEEYTKVRISIIDEAHVGLSDELKKLGFVNEVEHQALKGTRKMLSLFLKGEN